MTRKRTPEKPLSAQKPAEQRPSVPSEASDADAKDPFLSLPPPRDRQSTLTDEVELEAARLKSLQQSIPPGRPTREPEPLLSFANAQAPTNPPPRAREAVISEFPTAPPPPGALEAISKERGPEPIVEMRERYSLGDYTGALQIAEAIVHDHPGTTEAVECAERCRAVLVKMYAARIGPLDRVPVLMVAPNQLRWLSIDHRAGFVLSHIDGTSSLEMILDVSGMAPLDCLRILFELFQQRIISFR